jgi:hypothetical protein
MMNATGDSSTHAMRSLVICKTYDLIKNKKNWTQKDFCKIVGYGSGEVTKYCVIGAINNSCKDLHILESESVKLIHGLIDELNCFIKENYSPLSDELKQFSPLVMFNDYRTHDEVIDMLVKFGSKFGYISLDNNVT